MGAPSRRLLGNRWPPACSALLLLHLGVPLHRNRERPMSDLQAIADRVEIEALRAEFTDASMMHDWDRFASLFTDDGAWRMPHIDEEFVSRDEIRAGVERLRSLWEYFVQTVHQGTIQLEGDTAVGRSYVSEFGRFRDGTS